MSVLLWTVLGFIGGVMVSQNAEPMSNPEKASVVLGIIAAAGFTWILGYRGKALAVASAVATATATANANAESSARAAASSAINLYLGAQAGVTAMDTASIIDQSVQESITTSREFTPTIIDQEKVTT